MAPPLFQMQMTSTQHSNSDEVGRSSPQRGKGCGRSLVRLRHRFGPAALKDDFYTSRRRSSVLRRLMYRKKDDKDSRPKRRDSLTSLTTDGTGKFLFMSKTSVSSDDRTPPISPDRLVNEGGLSCHDSDDDNDCDQAEEGTCDFSPPVFRELIETNLTSFRDNQSHRRDIRLDPRHLCDVTATVDRSGTDERGNIKVYGENESQVTQNPEKTIELDNFVRQGEDNENESSTTASDKILPRGHRMKLEEAAQQLHFLCWMGAPVDELEILLFKNPDLLNKSISQSLDGWKDIKGRTPLDVVKDKFCTCTCCTSNRRQVILALQRDPAYYKNALDNPILASSDTTTPKCVVTDGTEKNPSLTGKNNYDNVLHTATNLSHDNHMSMSQSTVELSIAIKSTEELPVDVFAVKRLNQREQWFLYCDQIASLEVRLTNIRKDRDLMVEELEEVNSEISTLRCRMAANADFQLSKGRRLSRRLSGTFAQASPHDFHLQYSIGMALIDKMAIEREMATLASAERDLKRKYLVLMKLLHGGVTCKMRKSIRSTSCDNFSQFDE